LRESDTPLSVHVYFGLGGNINTGRENKMTDYKKLWAELKSWIEAIADRKWAVLGESAEATGIYIVLDKMNEMDGGDE